MYILILGLAIFNSSIISKSLHLGNTTSYSSLSICSSLEWYYRYSLECRLWNNLLNGLHHYFIKQWVWSVSFTFAWDINPSNIESAKPSSHCLIYPNSYSL